MSLPAALLFWGVGAVFTAPVASDDELAGMRGGFRLPSGIDIAMTVQTQTAIDGQIALRTVFKIDQGAPTLVAYVPRAGTSVAIERTAADPRAAAANPTITYDNRTGIRVTPGLANSVGVGSGGVQDLGDIPAGLVEAGAGSGVAIDARGGVKTARIDSADLMIVHVAGQAFGSAIANTANDRAIDTQTSVAIQVGNAAPDVIGSSLFRTQGVALDALAGRLR
ncbi:hypothetical protein ACFSC3_05575 [Sphingomonas floccifaciens]|uniref:Uncharacterized protein n=1 Tax=Sphingomonas floccifaciens TaxID=1844115 RepID=A0ABW4NA64_9SPHN